MGSVLGLVLRSTDERGASVDQAFSVTVISGDPNDTDGDQLPDAWELLHFPGIIGQGGGDDSDGDGQTNRQEYVFDTLPNNRSSMLTLQVAAFGATARSASWPSRPTRRYRLQTSDSLGDGAWVDSPAGLRQGTGATMSEVVPNGGARVRLFRLLVEVP